MKGFLGFFKEYFEVVYEKYYYAVLQQRPECGDGV